jgi:hypothetical protein
MLQDIDPTRGEKEDQKSGIKGTVENESMKGKSLEEKEKRATPEHFCVSENIK